jgi:hypothetical protein
MNADVFLGQHTLCGSTRSWQLLAHPLSKADDLLSEQGLRGCRGNHFGRSATRFLSPSRQFRTHFKNVCSS